MKKYPVTRRCVCSRRYPAYFRRARLPGRWIALCGLLLLALNGPSAHAQACVDRMGIVLYDHEAPDGTWRFRDIFRISSDGQEAFLTGLGPAGWRYARWSAGGGFTLLPDNGLIVAAVSANLAYAIGQTPDGAYKRWTTATGELVTIPKPASAILPVAVTTGGAVFLHAWEGLANWVNYKGAFRWTPGSLENIGDGNAEAYLFDVSDGGSVAIGYYLPFDEDGVVGSGTLFDRRWTAASGEWTALDGIPDQWVFVFPNNLSPDGTYVIGRIQSGDDNGDGNPDEEAFFRWSAPDHFEELDALTSLTHAVVLNDGTIFNNSGSSGPQYVWPPGGGSAVTREAWFAERGITDLENALEDDQLDESGAGGSTFRSRDHIVRLSGGCTPAFVSNYSPGYTYDADGGDKLRLSIVTNALAAVDVSFSPDGSVFESIGTAIPGQPVLFPRYDLETEQWTDILEEPLEWEALFVWDVPQVTASQAVLRLSGGGVTRDYTFRITGPAAVTPVISDVRLSGGTIRTDPFPGVSARLAQGETLVELQLTDSAGAYTFSEVEEGQTYDLKLTDTDTWGVERAWTGLHPQEVYKQVRLPATLMKQLRALTDTMALRHYDEDAVRALITPYEQWTGTDFTGQAAQVDTALARLIVVHQALQTMYGNTLPVSKELATALAELTGFALGFAQAWRAISSTMANRNLPIATARRFQNQTEGYAAAAVFNAITNPILAAMPSSPPELRTGLREARVVILAQMQAALSGQDVNALSLMQGAALRVGAAVGDDVLMELFSTLTQEDLDRAVARATAFEYAGDTRASWQAASQAGIANFLESDDAANFSLLTRGTASDIGSVTGLAGGFIRLVALARILRVAQLAGYAAAIGRTGYQFYDTAANDLPHAVDLAFDPLAPAPAMAPSFRPAEASARKLTASGGRATMRTEELEQAVAQYGQVVDELGALAQTDDREAFIEKLSELLDAADALSAAATRAQLPILAVAEEARQIDGYAAADAALAEALVHSGTHHLAFSAYALGYLDGKATPADLAAQADTTRSSFDAVVPSFDVVSALVADLPVPAFVAATEHSLSVDSVEAGEPFMVSATIRSGGGAAAADVVVTFVPGANVTLTSPPAFDLGELAVDEEQALEWTVAAHDTATVSTYQIHITSSNADALPAVGGFAVAGAVNVDVDDGTGGELPDRNILEQNYPNPFNPVTAIRYALSEGGEVRLAVYDLLGREVALLAEGRRPAGRHEVVFEAGGLPSGLYVYRLQAGGQVLIRRTVLVR